NLYPNPANDILNLSLSGSKRGNANLNLYTVHGKLVNSQRMEISESENRIQWNTGHLPAGVYLLKVETLYGEIIKKVVIRH
ncbi:MAG: T9SS type A sorting domain-containing protein, partial [Bacteroidetes bacterium]|nr:T9SS type A sorting domain-containing protein [Bacteroidota bacterium]